MGGQDSTDTRITNDWGPIIWESRTFHVTKEQLPRLLEKLHPIPVTLSYKGPRITIFFGQEWTYRTGITQREYGSVHWEEFAFKGKVVLKATEYYNSQGYADRYQQGKPSLSAV